MSLTWAGLKNVFRDLQATPHLRNAEPIGHWHRARQGQDRSVSDYITYGEN